MQTITDWTQNTMDDILDAGNEYYQIIRQSGRGDSRGYLGVFDLISPTIMYHRIVQLQTSRSWSEYIGRDNYSDIEFQKFFADGCNFGIIICAGISRAIMRQGDQFYLFDSHRSREWPHKSALYKFNTVADLIK